jgi:deferrochelatase/peroxidase EfeB
VGSSPVAGTTEPRRRCRWRSTAPTGRSRHTRAGPARLRQPPPDRQRYRRGPPSGVGPSLFDGRFGLAGKRSAALADLPELPGENLDAEGSNGDLVIQACADDPLVAFHAIRDLARLGRGTVVMRSQLGFGKANSNDSDQGTPRNLTGYKDGTRTIDGADASLMDAHVWVGASARTGCLAVATRWPAGSGCASRRGTATSSTTSRR